MTADQIPYSQYKPEQITQAYKQGGVSGLESLNLSDSDIIIALRRDCIGAPDITRTLKEANWSRERFIQAETNLGLDSESLDLVVNKFDSL